MDISQGSVATYFRCSGAFKYDFVANLPLSLPSKVNFENRLTFGEVVGKSLMCCFLTHGVYALTTRIIVEHNEPNFEGRAIARWKQQCLLTYAGNKQTGF